MKRYFIVMYTGYKDGVRVNCDANASTEDGQYINRIAFMQQAEEVYGIKDGIFTNIIELTESDYADWNANN